MHTLGSSGLCTVAGIDWQLSWLMMIWSLTNQYSQTSSPTSQAAFIRFCTSWCEVVVYVGKTVCVCEWESEKDLNHLIKPTFTLAKYEWPVALRRTNSLSVAIFFHHTHEWSHTLEKIYTTPTKSTIATPWNINICTNADFLDHPIFFFYSYYYRCFLKLKQGWTMDCGLVIFH